ncbi:MAG: DUF5777 family beta-barrel protein [Bacteroidales bacterium]
MKPFIILFLFLVCLAGNIVSQDLFDELGDWDDTESPVIKTFRSNRIVNLQSVEIPHTGELIFNIGHRFGSLQSGLYEMFGLDLATIRLGFDYGINRWLGAGIGRSSFEKTYDLYLKSRVITQEGELNSPISVSYYIASSYATLRLVYPADQDNFRGRSSIVQGLMISRKFSENFSLQFSPLWLRSSYLTETQSPADKLSLGIAGRIRLTSITHLNLEYIHEIIDDGFDNINPLSLGFDIETGGHVFQLFFSNTQGIIDKAYLVNTTGKWSNGDVFFGFTITRVFYL